MGWDDDILKLDVYTDWKNSTYAHSFQHSYS